MVHANLIVFGVCSSNLIYIFLFILEVSELLVSILTPTYWRDKYYSSILKISYKYIYIYTLIITTFQLVVCEIKYLVISPENDIFSNHGLEELKHI